MRFKCVDCHKDGIYHIQTTQENYWLCQYHMEIASENTSRLTAHYLNEEWLERAQA